MKALMPLFLLLVLQSPAEAGLKCPSLEAGSTFYLTFSHVRGCSFIVDRGDGDLLITKIETDPTGPGKSVCAFNHEQQTGEAVLVPGDSEEQDVEFEAGAQFKVRGLKMDVTLTLGADPDSDIPGYVWNFMDLNCEQIPDFE